MSSLVPVLLARQTAVGDNFRNLAERIDELFETNLSPRSSFRQITFCRECRSLVQLDMKIDFECPNCDDDLIAQS
jgi:hypothetical protein